jgi:hypothetical protein
VALCWKRLGRIRIQLCELKRLEALRLPNEGRYVMCCWTRYNDTNLACAWKQ